jgi:hypothetical protein
MLYAFLKAAPSKLEVMPYKPRSGWRNMSMLVLALSSLVVHRLKVRIMESKIRRKLREVVCLIITRNAVVEKLRRRPKVVFSACPCTNMEPFMYGVAEIQVKRWWHSASSYCKRQRRLVRLTSK